MLCKTGFIVSCYQGVKLDLVTLDVNSKITLSHEWRACMSLQEVLKNKKNHVTCRSHIYLPDSGWGPERLILLG